MPGNGNGSLENILSRLAALEQATAPQSLPDYSDPPLIFVKADGTPINPESFEKIPDLVKDLPVFTGDPSELNNWLSDVDSLVKLYQTNSTYSVEAQNKFHMICKTIRRKIRGEANDALVASNVGINWSVIKKTLITYYGEKRDLETLDYQLMTVQQRNQSLEKYYDEVNRLLSLIANQILTDERFAHPEASKALIETYHKKAIDAFIRGLDGDIYKFIRNYEPTSLAGAYSYCIEFQNVECRKMLTRPKHYEPSATPRNLIPLNPPRLPPKPMRPLPPRNPFQFQPSHRNHSRPPFMQFNNKPMQLNRQPPNFNNFGPRPNGPNGGFNPFFQQQQQHNSNKFSFPKPEPMDVDPSLRTNQVNYGNRPSNLPVKRPRLFNVETGKYEDQEDSEFDERWDYYPTEDEEYYPEESSSYERYMRQVEKEQRDAPEEEQVELNFLG